ncbi:MAG: hypothetical protein M3Y18_07335 [Candidatus Eremiobacteraeota bacterium]|nr:hypothetical protein [Candidatus Eremiobacteraeota bacterium]
MKSSAFAILFALATLAGCAAAPKKVGAPVGVATPNSAQTNPPGDIPDTQAFVHYSAPGGYGVLYPEGWSQSGTRNDTTFVSNFDGERIAMELPSDPAATVRRMFPSARAIHVHTSTIHGLPIDSATFTAQSQPDRVTGRRIALEEAAYFFRKKSREAVLVVWAPSGSDNVDQWKKISESFRWK